MKWNVDWLASAEKDLTKLWNRAPDRRELASAADTIDAALERDPMHQGEDRSSPNSRILFVEPLAVIFDVDEPNRQVTVRVVWRYPD